jgi:peptidoglycan/xylan/chitin deacetylase (PgdA/CDA1 family)
MKKLNKAVKRLSLQVTNTSLFAQAVAILERMEGGQPNLVRVLTYHRVNQPSVSAAQYPRIMVSPGVFAQQMRYLWSKYHVISIEELLDFYQGGRKLPLRAVIITFDDAYRDFAEYAWPILKQYGLPATLFVPTAFPDHPERVFWWDRLYQAICLAEGRDKLDTSVGRIVLKTPGHREAAFSRLRDHVKELPHDAAMAWVDQLCEQLDSPPPTPNVLGWQALRTLAQEGVTMGAHTRNHPLMTRIPPEVMHQEATESLQDLEREIGAAMPIFAYPSGGANREAIRVLDQAGFTIAFTTGHGINDLKTADRLCLRRINVGQNTSLPLLRMQMLSRSRYLYRS